MTCVNHGYRHCGLIFSARIDFIAWPDIVEEAALERVKAYAQAGADLVLADGITPLATLTRIREEAGLPVVFN